MKNAIVIGASSGIGKALAKLLVENGYRVVITGRREENLKKIKDENPDMFIVKSFDCTKVNNAQKLDEIIAETGKVDLLILSSGWGKISEELDHKINQDTIELNVKAFMEIADWTFNYFSACGEGHFVGISSIAGLRGSRFAPAYNASKAFQINYIEGLRQKACKSGKPITFTDIRPGFVDTDMAKGDKVFWAAPPEKAARQILKKIKKGKDFAYITNRWSLLARIFRLIPTSIYKRA